MKIHITNIKYKEKTREWNINIDTISGYKEYQDNDKADHSIWNFGDFCEFNNDLPTELILDLPENNVIEALDKIDELVKNKIKEKTSRDVDSYTVIIKD